MAYPLGERTTHVTIPSRKAYPISTRYFLAV
jgi:hypothetical protein